jgi:drug/metabolite transporter (DMT)-like permease
MPNDVSTQPAMTWLLFALMTVVSWGVYGIMLHAGVMAFDPKTDPTARYKAFLFVGIAYFLTAVLAPVAILIFKGASWEFLGNARGATWSLLAGIVGAVGAFCVLLAFAVKGSPAVVMSIVFAGAPIVNAAVALALHPPAGGLGSVRPQFFVGIVLAAIGGCLVTLYKDPMPPATPPTTAQPADTRVTPTE